MCQKYYSHENRYYSIICLLSVFSLSRANVVPDGKKILKKQWLFTDFWRHWRWQKSWRCFHTFSFWPEFLMFTLPLLLMSFMLLVATSFLEQYHQRCYLSPSNTRAILLHAIVIVPLHSFQLIVDGQFNSALMRRRVVVECCRPSATLFLKVNSQPEEPERSWFPSRFLTIDN